MEVYVFGNPDVESDNSAIKIAQELQGKISDVKFKFVNLNEDLPFDNGEDVVIMDTVEGIEKVEGYEMNREGVITSLTHPSSSTIRRMKVPSQEGSLNQSPRTTVHDYDLNFQLRYLQKLGKLGEVKIIGIPMNIASNSMIKYAENLFKKLFSQIDNPEV